MKELHFFVAYLVLLFVTGGVLAWRSRHSGDRGYFVGNRQMGAWVTALSAGAADMSAWVLMGLPTSIYALGLNQLWIPIGLALGYAASWIIEAPRLRAFSLAAGDAITVPQYLTQRFLVENRLLRVICSLVFLVAYMIYAASSIKACGTLFNTIVGVNETLAMCLSAFVIISYTFLGGFYVISWIDFFQGLLMLGALLSVPIFSVAFLEASKFAAIPSAYWSIGGDWKTIISGLAWGLGYFGMPHIVVKFIALKSNKELIKAARIGITWNFIILFFAVMLGVVGRIIWGLDDSISQQSLVFIVTVRKLFPVAIAGVLLSAVLAASMSTADNQLLAASSALVNDVYRPIVTKDQASPKELLWCGRIVVVLIALAALVIALCPSAGSIMDLVRSAWGLFGAAFGPVILLSLFWPRFTFNGVMAGILGGTLVDLFWPFLGSGIYELAPAFVAGTVCAVIATLTGPQPDAKVKELIKKALRAQAIG